MKMMHFIVGLLAAALLIVASLAALPASADHTPSVSDEPEATQGRRTHASIQAKAPRPKLPPMSPADMQVTANPAAKQMLTRSSTWMRFV